MKRLTLPLLLAVAYCLGLCSLGFAQVPPPTTAIYQILSGTSRVEGGFVGSLIARLPNAGEMFIQLGTNSQGGGVEMRFLDSQQRVGEFVLTNGLIVGNVIRFYQLVAHPYASVAEKGIADYSVTKDSGTLQVQGTVTFPPICCDIPTFYEHSNVVAQVMPRLDMRVSEVEISWDTVSNRTYQLQYRPSLTQGLWTNLGAPVVGNGQTMSAPDRVPAAEAGRLYRVLTLP